MAPTLYEGETLPRMDPCPKCGSTRTKDMRRTGGAAWENAKVEVPKEDYEWTKCANCGIFSRRPLSGGDWEPRYESREPPA